MWIVALVVSAICIAGLAYGLLSDWNTKPERRPELLEQQRRLTSGDDRSFYLGLGIGLGAGIVLASIVALRKRA
jgi:hypothetical protein